MLFKSEIQLTSSNPIIYAFSTSKLLAPHARNSSCFCLWGSFFAVGHLCSPTHPSDPCNVLLIFNKNQVWRALASHGFWVRRASGGVSVGSAFRAQDVKPTRHLVHHNLCSRERHLPLSLGLCFGFSPPILPPWLHTRSIPSSSVDYTPVRYRHRRKYPLTAYCCIPSYTVEYPFHTVDDYAISHTCFAYILLLSRKNSC